MGDNKTYTNSGYVSYALEQQRRIDSLKQRIDQLGTASDDVSNRRRDYLNEQLNKLISGSKSTELQQLEDANESDSNIYTNLSNVKVSNNPRGLDVSAIWNGGYELSTHLDKNTKQEIVDKDKDGNVVLKNKSPQSWTHLNDFMRNVGSDIDTDIETMNKIIADPERFGYVEKDGKAKRLAKSIIKTATKYGFKEIKHIYTKEDLYEKAMNKFIDECKAKGMKKGEAKELFERENKLIEEGSNEYIGLKKMANDAKRQKAEATKEMNKLAEDLEANQKDAQYWYEEAMKQPEGSETYAKYMKESQKYNAKLTAIVADLMTKATAYSELIYRSTIFSEDDNGDVERTDGELNVQSYQMAFLQYSGGEYEANRDERRSAAAAMTKQKGDTEGVRRGIGFFGLWRHNAPAYRATKDLFKAAGIKPKGGHFAGAMAGVGTAAAMLGLSYWLAGSEVAAGTATVITRILGYAFAAKQAVNTIEGSSSVDYTSGQGTESTGQTSGSVNNNTGGKMMDPGDIPQTGNPQDTSEWLRELANKVEHMSPEEYAKFMDEQGGGQIYYHENTVPGEAGGSSKKKLGLGDIANAITNGLLVGISAGVKNQKDRRNNNSWVDLYNSPEPWKLLYKGGNKFAAETLKGIMDNIKGGSAANPLYPLVTKEEAFTLLIWTQGEFTNIWNNKEAISIHGKLATLQKEKERIMKSHIEDDQPQREEITVDDGEEVTVDNKCKNQAKKDPVHLGDDLSAKMKPYLGVSSYIDAGPSNKNANIYCDENGNDLSPEVHKELKNYLMTHEGNTGLIKDDNNPSNWLWRWKITLPSGTTVYLRTDAKQRIDNLDNGTKPEEEVAGIGNWRTGNGVQGSYDSTKYTGYYCKTKEEVDLKDEATYKKWIQDNNAEEVSNFKANA